MALSLAIRFEPTIRQTFLEAQGKVKGDLKIFACLITCLHAYLLAAYDICTIRLVYLKVYIKTFPSILKCDHLTYIHC